MQQYLQINSCAAGPTKSNCFLVCWPKTIITTNCYYYYDYYYYYYYDDYYDDYDDYYYYYYTVGWVIRSVKTRPRYDL